MDLLPWIQHVSDDNGPLSSLGGAVYIYYTHTIKETGSDVVGGK